jgi:probable phosphoglycerate mutase
LTILIQKEPNPQQRIVYFSRHAEYSSDILGVMNLDSSQKYPLTFQGIQQSYLLGKKLNSCSIEKIFVSDYIRTQQTAYIINDHLDIPAEIISHPLINEFNPGEQFEGKSFKHYLFDNPSDQQPLYPQGECFQDVLIRVQNFCNDLEKNYAHYNILVITHGYILRTVQYLLGDISKDQAFKGLDFPQHCFFLPTKIIQSKLQHL